MHTWRTRLTRFSSAFYTIQPHILIDKMLGMNNVPSWLISWIFDYLTQRSQFVRLSEDIKSSIVVSNTGCPQGTVLAPFIFTLFTADIRSLYPSCPLVKFADDTAMLGLIKMDNSNLYEKQVQTFVEYCDRNYLELNVKKTKEMVIDMRRSRRVNPAPISIKGSDVDRTNQYYINISVYICLMMNYPGKHIVIIH